MSFRLKPFFAILSTGIIFVALSQTGKSAPGPDKKYSKYGIYAKTAPIAKSTKPVDTTLPLKLAKGDRIAYIGNTLLDRAQHFGQFEAMLHQWHPEHHLVVRNLSWSADTPNLQPRPNNFANVAQHLTYEKIDVIFAAFGYNESFAGKAGLTSFRTALAKHLANLKAKAFSGITGNDETGPRIVLVSPIANENTARVKAADRNNANIKLYVDAMKQVAAEQGVGFVDVFAATEKAMAADSDLTINGAHLNSAGYALFAKTLFHSTFGKDAPSVDERIRQTILDKNRQYFRRYRPANTFYYTGGRSKTYGYLDFLPAMQNFEIMTANRDQRIWALAQGKKVPAKVDDSNVPPLPKSKESRGANRWKTAADELKDFKIDPRFDVTLFAGEEEFPDIAAPIQMRWDAKGRLWVACSTTYPHVYPGNEANDKLVILEDTDGDGKADKSSVFADDLHIPLSFEFGDGGVYVSEMPNLTFIKDTDGDGKADYRERVLTGFGTEDSHHALHDFAWTPDGDLIFREAVFHHSQVETPYGPVRQQNSGWFRFQPRDQRLTSFGTYSSTNPWGVTFDDWGQHMASHPVFASAFHALDPPYPTQHPRPNGLQAYSGVCGQEFVDFATFPDELKGHFIKVRYKPTNRVEIHKWVENDFGYNEKYVSDLLFSKNLSFIPVDLRYGPRGAMYVCDWYNPVKGHAQYSLRDERRDRHSGRIWRITAKGKKLTDPPKIDGASIPALLDILKRPEYRYRYWTKRELRLRDPAEVKQALDAWVAKLDPSDPRFRHHQVEAIWTYRGIGAVNIGLLKEVLACDEHHARAAATRQLRYWHIHTPDAIKLLASAANDPNGLVRMEAAIAASYIGTKDALDAMLAVLKYPAEKHLRYAITASLGSHTLRRHWEADKSYNIAKLLKKMSRASALKEPTPSASQAQFDVQKGLKKVTIGCIPERMMYTMRQFTVKPGQPVKLVFMNGDATDHNLVIVKPGALEQVGLAANEMAKDPRQASSDFIPRSKKDLILQHAPMIGPTRKNQVHVLRFNAPTEPGVYPYVCTFPGHWVIMSGNMIVANNAADAKQLLAASGSQVIKDWAMQDFKNLAIKRDEATLMRGMAAFKKGRCTQCHVVRGHGTSLGPDLTDVAKRFTGHKLLEQMIVPSSDINEKYRNYQFVTVKGKIITGVVVKKTDKEYHICENLLLPDNVTKIAIDDIDEQNPARLSPMPEDLLNTLSKDEIHDILSYLEAGGYQLPKHLKDKHGHAPQ
jgi:putative heme-binding domain-containing protein